MIYSVEEDSIYLKDEDGQEIAHIEMPVLAEGVREIKHIYGETTKEGVEYAQKLMEVLVKEMRKRGQVVIPSSPFAMTWFGSHSEASDVLWNPMGQQAGVNQKDPANKKSVIKVKNGRDKTKVKRQKSGKTKTVVKKAGNTALSMVNRLLQLICVLILVVQTLMYISSAGKHSSEFVSVFQQARSGSTSSLIRGSSLFVALSIILIAFMIIAILWTLSRKGYAVEGRVVRLDSGRGLFDFILLGIGFMGCSAAVRMAASSSGAQNSIILFANTYIAKGKIFFYLCIIGAILCVIRRIIGK